MRGHTVHALSPIKILVISPSSIMGEYLRSHMPAGEFEVITTLPGATVIEMADHVSPQIAVIDHIEERPKTVVMEVMLLKEMRPGIRIIILSGRPSANDAEIVERGVFYYMSIPVGPPLIEVIEAAARAIRNEMGKPRTT